MVILRGIKPAAASCRCRRSQACQLELKVVFLVLAVLPVRGRDRQDQAEELRKAPLRRAELLRALPMTGEERCRAARRRPSASDARSRDCSLCFASSFSSVKASGASAGGSSTDTGCKVSQFEIVLLLIRCDRRSPAEFCGSHLCCYRIAGVKRHISWSSRGCLARSCV